MTSLKIDLDYAQNKQTLSFWNLLCLAFSIALAGYVALQLMEAFNEKTALEAKVQKAVDQNQRPRAGIYSKTPNNQFSEINQANAILTELGQPWPALFAVLEEKTSQDIALLSVRPDGTKKRLLITGEAFDMEDVLSYVKALASADILKDVVLEKHEVTESDKTDVVRFTISALWRN